jgi:phage baseplate assembly protein W
MNGLNTNTDFLGKGFTFPLQTNLRGGIKAAQYQEKIRQSIMIILGTRQGERVMRPNFGSKLKSLAFAPLNAATANLARHYVEESLKTWEKRIQLDEVIVQNENQYARFLIHIRYHIKSTNEPGNLVYPFYLQQP